MNPWVPAGESFRLRLQLFIQPAGKEEVWDHDDPVRSRTGDKIDGFLKERTGYSDKAGHNPGKGVAFSQQTAKLIEITVGVGIAGPAPNDNGRYFGCGRSRLQQRPGPLEGQFQQRGV